MVRSTITRGESSVPAAAAVILLGMPRSGTTLLKEMLDHHPGVAIPPESYFIPSLWRRFRIRRSIRSLLDDLAALPQLRLWGVDPDDVRRRVGPHATFADVIAALYRAYAARWGKPRYGDKTPAYVEDLGILEHAFPGAKYLHIIRDGRDAALSHEEMHGRSRRALAFPRTLMDYACRWSVAITRVRRLGAACGPRRYHEVRYERLVAEPEVTLHEICRFLSLDYDPAMLAYHRDPARPPRPAHARLAEPPSLGTRNWRTQMPRRSNRRFEALAGRVLSDLGYERTIAAPMRGRGRASVDRFASTARVACWRAIAWVGPLTPMWRTYQGVRFRRELAEEDGFAGARGSAPRVLLYAIDFAPLIGGEERYLLRLGTALSRNNGTNAAAEHSASAVSAPRAAVLLATRTPSNGHDDSLLRFSVLRQPSLALLWRLLGAADLLHISGPVLLPLLLGWLRRKPTVVTHHTHHAACPNGLLFHHPSASICPGHFRAGHLGMCLRCNAESRGWLRSLGDLLATFPRRWLCQRVDVHLVVSHAVGASLALPRSKIVYHRVATPHIPSAASAKEGGAPALQDPQPRGMRATRSEAMPCFAYVGRLVPEKGVSVLLQAAARLAADGYAFRVRVIGDGPERAALEQLARHTNIHDRVEFAGFLLGAALEAALDDVMAVVVPSLYLEPAGLVAIEHMMRGGLVIASNVGGLSEMVGDAGMTFPPGDTDALATCLHRVLDDRNLAAVFGSAATHRAESVFRGDHDIRAHLEVYEQLATQRGSTQ